MTKINSENSEVLIPRDSALLDEIIDRAVDKALRRHIQTSSAEKARAIPSQITAQTVDDFADYNLKTRNIQESTSNSYIADMRTFTKFIACNFERDVFTSDLTPEKLQEFVITRRRAEISDKTISRECQGIIAFSNFAYSKGLIDSPLTLKAAKLRFRKRRKIHPRVSEETYLILMQCDFKISDPLVLRNWAFLNFLFYTDLAITVALNLKRSAIDLATKKILVKDRSFNLPDKLVVILEEYIDESALPDSPLFPSCTGRHICPSNYRKFIFTRAIKRVAPSFKVCSHHPRDLPSEIQERVLAIPTL